MFEDVPSRRLRILAEHTPGIWRYIAKIVPYKLPDGGFAFIPAYPGFSGHAMKIKMADTFSHLVQPPPPVILEGRSVSHRIKAFHHDGSTQLSGADSTTSVTSGREADGAFKGLGILGRPFSKPVFTGSVIGMTAWGLSFYPRANVSKDVVRFSINELGKKGLLGRAAVLFSGFLIKRSDNVEVVSNYPDLRIRTRRWNGHTGRRENMELRVCNLYSPDSYLAIDCVRRPIPKADRNPSGYMMSTQRGYDHTGLHAFFPGPRGAKTYGTLNRGPVPDRLILPSD